ncbi:Elongation factor G [compost metagenome]
MLEALRAAGEVVLEPVVTVEVTTPETNLGDITTDLIGRRGQVTGTESLSQGMALVHGQAPLAELDGYAGRLKAITAGHGAFNMVLSHYAAAPQDVQQRLKGAYKADQEED